VYKSKRTPCTSTDQLELRQHRITQSSLSTLSVLTGLADHAVASPSSSRLGFRPSAHEQCAGINCVPRHDLSPHLPHDFITPHQRAPRLISSACSSSPRVHDPSAPDSDCSAPSAGRQRHRVQSAERTSGPTQLYALGPVLVQRSTGRFFSSPAQPPPVNRLRRELRICHRCPALSDQTQLLSVAKSTGGAPAFNLRC